jgi:imidazolonepropionase-like amidohydrolase
VRFEGLRGVLRGAQTLYVHADDVKAISEALRFKKEMMISKMVIVGGYDAWMIAEELKAEKVGVMLRRVHELPMLTGEDVSLPFKLPALLSEAGVEFCLQNEGDMERMGTRNLPFFAGTAVAYGLPYEEAVKSLTLSAANLLGIGEKCGSIQSGKDATLFISSGDALDMRTNNVVYAFIQGRMIKLDNKQKALYERYLAK